MGFGIIRCKKVKRPNLNGLRIFWDSSVQKGCVLRECANVREEIIKRVREFQGQQLRKIRADAPYALHYLVTLSQESAEKLGEEQIKAYLSESLSFLDTLHGQNNIIAAFISDTGHVMHVLAVPEKEGKLNAKAFTELNALRGLQESFFRNVSSKYGLERGVKGQRHKTQEEENFERLKVKSEKLEKRIKVLAGESLEPPVIEYPEPGLLEGKKAYAERCLKRLWDYSLQIIQVSRAKALAYDDMQKEKLKLEQEIREIKTKLIEEQTNNSLLRLEIRELEKLFRNVDSVF